VVDFLEFFGLDVAVTQNSSRSGSCRTAALQQSDWFAVALHDVHS
jgi:hypothetical protein